MNNFNIIFQVVIFYLCLICLIRCAKIDFSSNPKNSFRKLDNIDMNCNYKLEDNEKIKNLVIQSRVVYL
jgi:hypothetical protein